MQSEGQISPRICSISLHLGGGSTGNPWKWTSTLLERMELEMKKGKLAIVVLSLPIAAFLAITAAAPLSAGTITIMSDATNVEPL